MPIALPPLALEEITQSAEDPFAALNAMLREYNVGQVGPANHVPLWVFARDASGKVQGGVRGQTYWSWCAIDMLTVAQPSCLRGWKRLRGHAGVLEFASTPQAFKHPVSTTGTDTPNLAASKVIRQVIAVFGS